MRREIKRTEFFVMIATCMLLASAFAAIPAFSVQPPLVATTYYVGTIGQPARLDPARAYDTASGELIQNVYQPLIWYADKHPIYFTSANATTGYNLTSSDMSDLSEYAPVIATKVPTFANGGIIYNASGIYYTFTINPNAQFPAWTAANGTWMPAQNVTVDDVVYSFQRQLVYDSPASPEWMWLQTAFNPGWWTFDDGGYSSYANGTFHNTLFNQAGTFNTASPSVTNVIDPTPVNQADTFNTTLPGVTNVTNDSPVNTFNSTVTLFTPYSNIVGAEIDGIPTSNYTVLDSTTITFWDMDNLTSHILQFDYQYYTFNSTVTLSTPYHNIVGAKIDGIPTSNCTALSNTVIRFWNMENSTSHILQFDYQYYTFNSTVTLSIPYFNIVGAKIDGIPTSNYTALNSRTVKFWNMENSTSHILEFDYQYTYEDVVGSLISSWVYASGGNNVTFHFLYTYAPVAMYQIFSQTWGSIVERAWVIEHGGWKGSFYTTGGGASALMGWSNDFRRKPSNSYSELDQYKDPAVYGWAGSKYTSGAHDIPNMLGTGPYLFTSWDKTTKTWRIDYNPNYWQGFATAGAGDGLNFIHTVIETGVNTWPTRKMLFLEGEFDAAVVPRANMYDMLRSTYNPLAGISLVCFIPTLSNDAFFFTMNVSTASAYQPFLGYPTHVTGAEALFFADEHIRRAFAWAINYTEYINDAWFGEAIQHGSWWVTGLTPLNANDSLFTLRNLNYANMQAELDQAALIDGHNVSVDGFDVTFLYNTGNDQRRIVAEALAAAWQSLGSKYHVNVVRADWPVFLDLMVSRGMPGYSTGWLADFADAADFAGVYMSSSGSLSGFQGPPYPADQATIDQEIINASTAAEPVRVTLYHDLESRYWNNCLSIALDQPVGRRFARDWVQGWYDNQLLPGLYAYDLYKQIIGGALQQVDLNMSTLTPIVNYTTIYIFHQQMRIGGGLGNGDQPITPMKYTLTVTRSDNNGGLIYATLGLTRTPGEVADAKEFGNGTYVLVAPLGSSSATLTWYEDGSSQWITGASWKVGGKTYTVGAESYPLTSNTNDTDLSNNKKTNGTFVAKTLPGDVDGNGIVDIYDALKLAIAFGTSTGQKRYNADADLNSPTPDGTIDIYDAIILASNFNKSVQTV